MQSASGRLESGPETRDALVTAYLEHARVQKRLAQRTLTLYAIDLQKLQAFAMATAVPLPAVENQHVRRWVAQMHAKGRSGRGIALVLSGWRGFYTWLGREGLVSGNPVQDVRAPKAARPLPKALSVDDAVQLASYKHTGDDPWLEARDVAIVELLYGAGLRISELTGLDLVPDAASRGWLDLQAGEAHVLGKGSKRRTIPVTGKALQAVAHWLTCRDQIKLSGQNALFVGRTGTRLGAQSIWQRLRRRSHLAHLPVPVHPHMLRHSFASHVLQSSGDLRAVQELLGHANISTTQVYTKLDFQHLAKAYDAAHPRARSRKPA